MSYKLRNDMIQAGENTQGNGAFASKHAIIRSMAKFDDLWRNEQTLQAVLDNISDGVLTYNRDLNITGVNRAAVEILGYPAEEIVGKHCTDVFRCGVCDPGCGFAMAWA